jgi:hypothetical protein
MTALSNYLEGQILDHLLRTGSWVKPTTLYIALFTAAPSDSGGGTEVTGGNYARAAIVPLDANFSAPAGGNGTSYNLDSVVFNKPSASWGTVTHVGIFDALTSGNLLVWGALSASVAIAATTTTPFLAVGAINIQIDG